LSRKIKRVAAVIGPEPPALAGSTTESLRKYRAGQELGSRRRDRRLNATTEKILQLE